jgi:hypothetical protein
MVEDLHAHAGTLWIYVSGRQRRLSNKREHATTTRFSLRAGLAPLGAAAGLQLVAIFASTTGIDRGHNSQELL